MRDQEKWDVTWTRPQRWWGARPGASRPPPHSRRCLLRRGASPSRPPAAPAAPAPTTRGSPQVPRQARWHAGSLGTPERQGRHAAGAHPSEEPRVTTLGGSGAPRSTTAACGRRLSTPGKQEPPCLARVHRDGVEGGGRRGGRPRGRSGASQARSLRSARGTLARRCGRGRGDGSRESRRGRQYRTGRAEPGQRREGAHATPGDSQAVERALGGGTRTTRQDRASGPAPARLTPTPPLRRAPGTRPPRHPPRAPPLRRPPPPRLPAPPALRLLHPRLLQAGAPPASAGHPCRAAATRYQAPERGPSRRFDLFR